MDAFFAAIEQRDNPELRGKPVVVGSSPDKRGVVATCSYEARQYGIHSAMASREAGRRCPHAVFIRPNLERYSEVSRQVFAIFERFTPLVEPLSIDEAFLDVTGATRLFGAPEDIARQVRAALREELGLTGSVGVAHNLFLAKLASDMQKPDGQTAVPRDTDAVRDFLAPLPIRRLWGVGPTTASLLKRHNIHLIGDVQKTPPELLELWLGRSLGRHLARLAFGLDERDVALQWKEKSISREHTFTTDERNRDVILHVLRELTDDVAQQVRQNANYATVGRLKLRWEDFSTITRQAPFAMPAHDNFTFRELALKLFESAYTVRPVRLVGFGVTGFTSERSKQLLLFDDPIPQRDKRESLSRTLDEIRARHGGDAISLGRLPKINKGT